MEKLLYNETIDLFDIMDKKLVKRSSAFEKIELDKDVCFSKLKYVF